jgi:hypothetical protein
LYLAVVLSLILLLPTAVFADFSGPVVGISDGDTITVLHDRKAEKFRLNGIVCPEKGQPFGSKAKQFTSSIVFGKTVTVQTHGRDRGVSMGGVYARARTCASPFAGSNRAETEAGSLSFGPVASTIERFTLSITCA